MGLTDLSFDRSSRIENRYDLIRSTQRPDSAPPVQRKKKGGSSSEEYASFLKQKERSVGPDGFLDSARYCHPYTFKSKKSPQSPRKSQSVRSLNSSVSLSTRIDQDSKDFEKKMKVIEDHMWHHKQEGRELKRVEGDVVKNQQALRHSIQDYENAIHRKRRAEEKKLSKGLEKYTVLQRETTHRKEELNRERKQHNINMDLDYKDVDRKAQLMELDIRRKYELKKSELELQREQRLQLSLNLEEKIRASEEQEFKLQKELADLSIGLNMEAQKRREQTFHWDSQKKKEKTEVIQSDMKGEKSIQLKLTKGDGDIKVAEMTKRKLSADLLTTKSRMAIKSRDEQRRLTDTQIRLSDNANMQRQLHDAARFADMDLKAKKIDQRLQAHNERRQAQLSSRLRDKQDREEAQQVILQEKFRKRYNEQRRKEHDDKLKFFQKIVNKGEETEQNLYNKVRNAEYARQKEDQTIKHLQLALYDLKRNNANRIKKEMADSFRQEKELDERLIRAKASLDKEHSRREESYVRLQNHRAGMKEDVYQLQEHTREQERLNKIGLKSDMHSDSFIY